MKFTKPFNLHNRHRREPRANDFVLESLEPRLLLSATPMTAAVVTTDHLDYAPGETAVITTANTNGDGLQFGAGELVRFQVSRTDGMADNVGSTADVGPMGNEAWYVVDGVGGFTVHQQFDAMGQAIDRDGNGVADWIAPDNDLTVNSSISTSWFVEEQYRNSSLLVAAIGQESGAVASQAFTDAKINTSTVVTSSSATSTYGDHVTFTARVTPAVGTARPVGTVEFFDGTRSLGIDSTVGKGSGSTAIFTISISNLTAGTHAIHAVFTGGTGHEPERAGSERHDAHEHRDLQRQSDNHRHDGERQGHHRQGRHEFHHRGHDHTHHESLNRHQYNNSTSDNIAQTVSQKSLTASFTAASKTYDGTTTATVQTQTLAGVIASDDVSLNGGTAAFVDANAGNGKTVTLVGATLTGTGASNYSLAPFNTTTADITKADATVSVNGYTGVYDGAAHGATGSATGVGGVNLSGGLNLGASFTNAPGGTANWTFSGGTNYHDANGSVAIVINQANAVITLTSYVGTYDGAAHQATGTATGVLGESLAGLNLSVTSHSNAGVYIDTVTFTDGTGNYKDTIKNVKSTINKANATLVLTGYYGTYDGAAHQATGTATGVLGESLAGLDLSVTSHSNAGVYIDTVTFTDVTGNYKDTIKNVKSTINKANATLVLTGYVGTYDGAAHEATGTATGVLGESLAGLDLSGTSHTNAGVYIDTVTFTDVTGNYKDTIKNVKSTINKANATFVLTGYYGTYDGAAHEATGTATGVLGESLAGLGLSVTSHSNAGVYIDTVTFTDGTGNYKDTIKNVKSTIYQANAVITVTGYSVTFDGLAHTATGTATGVLGEDLSAGLDLSSTTHTNVGTYLNVVTFTDVTGNYKFTVKNVSSRIL